MSIVENKVSIPTEGNYMICVLHATTEVLYDDGTYI